MEEQGDRQLKDVIRELGIKHQNGQITDEEYTNQLARNKQDLRDALRRGAVADAAHRLLIFRAQHCVPRSLHDATEPLLLKGGTGSLGHQSSVLLWNAERTLQSILLLAGQGSLTSNGDVSHETIGFRLPLPVHAASVVPHPDAIRRMRTRVSHQLRLAVWRHFVTYRGDELVGTRPVADAALPNAPLTLAGVESVFSLTDVPIEALDETPDAFDHHMNQLSDAFTGVQYGNPNRPKANMLTQNIWMNYALINDSDLLDYAVNIDGWKREMDTLRTGPVPLVFGVALRSQARINLAQEREEIVLALAYRLRHI
jgi:hypothetical protein